MTRLCVRRQACRGDKHDEPATAAAFDDVDSELKKNEVEVDASAVHTLPAGADFIMCYSVAEGEVVVGGLSDQGRWHFLGSK